MPVRLRLAGSESGRVLWPVVFGLALGIVVMLVLRWLSGEAGGAEPAVVEADPGGSGMPMMLPDGSAPADVQPIEIPAPAELDGDVAAPDLGDEPAPAPAPGTGSLTLYVVWGDDGSPAAGVGVDVRSETVPRHMPPVMAMTDDDGWTRIDGLPAGEVTVRGDRGGTVSAVIVEYQIAEATLALPIGPWVHGVVLDPDGNTVAGADIWLSAENSLREGQVVTQSGVDGAFELRSVPLHPRHFLAARGAGWGPSPRATLPETDAPTVEVTLRMTPPGGDVTVQVVDEEGGAIPEATVLLGGDNGWLLEAQDRLTDITRVVPPRLGVADSQGLVRFMGVPAGKATVDVRAPGKEPGWEYELVKAREMTKIVVTLYPGAGLTGRVLARAGDSGDWVGVPGVQVVGIPVDSFIQPGEFLETVVTSGEDGVWVMDDLDSWEETMILAATHDLYGQTTAEEKLVKGRVREGIDLWLTRGLELRGRVVDEDGAPLEGWSVVAMGVYSWRASTVTDASGSFAMSNAERQAHTLLVREPDAPTSIPVLIREGVLPDTEPMTLVVDDDDVPSAEITFSLVDPDGQSVSAATILVGPMNERALMRVTETSVPGSYRTGLLPPGEYELRVLPSRYPGLVIEDLGLAADERRDLGELSLGRGGRILVHLSSTPPLEDWSDYWVWCISHDGTRQVDMDPTEEGWMSNPLEPGTYTVSLEGDGMANESRTVVVQSGETTELTVNLSQGVECEFKLIGLDQSDTVHAYRDRTLWSRYFSFEVDDETGVPVVRLTNDLDRALEKDWARSLDVGLRPGSYTARVKVGGVIVGEREFEVSTLGAGPAVIRLGVVR